MLDTDSEPDINLKQAVGFIRAAWLDVSPVVIHNCWAHTRLIDKGIILATTNTRNITESDLAATPAQMSDIQAILMILSAAGSLLTDAEHIDIDAAEPTEQEMSDKEILQAVMCEANNSDEVAENEDEDEDQDPAPPPSLCEAQQALTVVPRYFQSSNNTTEDDIDKVMDYR